MVRHAHVMYECTRCDAACTGGAEMHNCLVASVGWRGSDFDLSLEIFHDLYDALTVAQLMLSPSRVVRAARRGPHTVSGHTPSLFLGSRGGRNVGWWRGQGLHNRGC